MDKGDHFIAAHVPKKMRAVLRVAGKEEVELAEIDVPVPGVGDALLQIICTTICGSDVHIVKGELAQGIQYSCHTPILIMPCR